MEHVAQDYLSYAVVKEEAVRLAVGSFRELASETIIRHDADPSPDGCWPTPSPPPR